MSDQRLPTDEELALPTLRALEQRGGSASNEEIAVDLARILNLPEAALNELHGSGPQTELEYRAAWARTILRWIGAVENSQRGIWSVTEAGRKFLADESRSPEATERRIKNRIRKYRQGFVKKPQPSASPPIAASKLDRERLIGVPDFNDDPRGHETANWKEELLETIRSMKPDAFERLCQRVLREHGFTEVKVTGRIGDQGVDGKGVLRLGLVSFQVMFQCKCYQGSVSSRELRDFRGAIVGRGDKGLFLTTGSFTAGAKSEAIRDGAPTIDLIDGLALCQLLKDRDLGVETQMVEQVTINAAFFNHI